MRLVISDTSCLIDLRKVLLLEAFVSLPYELAIPDVLFHGEVLQFTEADKNLLAQQLRILTLPGEGVIRVQEVQRDHPALTINDCFAFVLAERNSGCILLTGDNGLRTLSSSSGIEVHGLLWIIDEMHDAQTATIAQLYAALQQFQADAKIWLPKPDLTRSLEKYGKLL